MPYFNSDHTGLCQTNEVIWQMGNLTASYAAGNGKEVLLLVSAPVVVLILVVLFVHGMYGFGDAVLHPRYRLVLSSALGLSLPVMSYLFSEAKDAAGEGEDDLSVRARVILTWMLALELLRKKVDEIRAWGSYSSTLQRAGRVLWLGSLVYFNITSPGRKAVFSILWILCAMKLLQRIVFTEVEKRSYPDKSWIISSYMDEMLAAKRDQEASHSPELVGDEVLKRCRYIVMGEEKLVRQVTANGYELNTITPDDSVITVGKVCELSLEYEGGVKFDLKRVCLSFALFKLLRRRFEHLPDVTEEEARDCRTVLMRGLRCSNDETMEAEQEEQVFQVMADEMKFLCEYYHSVVPVVLASPSFVVANYLLVPVAVLGLCLIAILVCGKGHVGYVLSRMSSENYALQPGFAQVAICSVARAAESRPALFFVLDLSITILLFIIFLLEETWELLAVLTSNWFVISMLCNYTAKRQWRASPAISGAFRLILWLRRKMSTNIRVKQFCLMDCVGLVPPHLGKVIRSVPATQELKRAIIKCLVEHARDRDATPLTNGTSVALDKYDLTWIRGLCSSDSVTEVILTWHVATCLLDAITAAGQAPVRKVAVTLSQYCAYLVAFHPELLPDKRAKAELVLEDAIKEIMMVPGFRRCHLASNAVRIAQLAYLYPTYNLDGPYRLGGVVAKGLYLGRRIVDLERTRSGLPEETSVWEMLADVWTELMVYAAPARDEEHVNAHADILPGGVELITVLWAFAMHTGVSRPPPAPATPLAATTSFSD